MISRYPAGAVTGGKVPSAVHVTVGVSLVAVILIQGDPAVVALTSIRPVVLLRIRLPVESVTVPTNVGLSFTFTVTWVGVLEASVVPLEPKTAPVCM